MKTAKIGQNRTDVGEQAGQSPRITTSRNVEPHPMEFSEKVKALCFCHQLPAETSANQGF